MTIMAKNLLFHFRPHTVLSHTLRYQHTWGLGGAAVLLILIQFATGLLLRFAYEPSPIEAYLSIQYIRENMFFGPLFRNLHHWSGHLLIAVGFLHMLRVFYYQAYCGPRAWNWLIGLAMFVLICAANFTGYLLPWDQLSYWAVTIAANIFTYLPVIGPSLLKTVGGASDLSDSTLFLFYTIHTGILPVLLFTCMMVHFWKIRKAGGLYLKKTKLSNGQAERVAANPDLFQRELAFAAVVSALCLLLAVFLDVPLHGMADAEVTPETIRAPWYFVGLQELLLHISPGLAWLLLISGFTFFALQPIISHRNWIPPRINSGIFTILVIGYALLTVMGRFFRGPAMQFTLPW